MKKDTVANALNEIMNMKRVGKTEVKIKYYSRLLINLFEMMKSKGHIDYSLDEEKKEIVVKILKLNECKAIKPRYYVTVQEIDRYLRRFVPSRNFGSLVVSTNAGLKTHKEAEEEKLGGALIAYFY